MEFAVDCTGKRIHASEAIKEKEYFCPLCDNKVILRQGEINIEHFAHIKKCDDNWHYDMSEWHLEWQKQFPKNNREVVMEHNGEKHRADVLACGYVIEFQHSSITAEEFNERNRFYLSTLKKELDINYMDLGEYYFHDDKIDENYDTKTEVAKIRKRLFSKTRRQNKSWISN